MPTGATADDQRALLELRVNGIHVGVVLVVIRSSDVLIRPEDLEKAGMLLSSGRRETIAGESFLSLASLIPAAKYQIDPKNLSIDVIASAALFKQSNLNIAGGGRPADLVFESAPAGFVNYSLMANDFDSVGTFFEGGVSVNELLLYSSVSLNNSSLMRGLTNATWDDPDNMRRIILGDTVLTPAELGGGGFIAGLTIQKNFSLNPYFIRYPTQTVSGAVTMPSTAYIYRDGVLVNEVRLAPGPFNLSQIPGISGFSNTQVVIQDALGGRQVVNAPYYATTTLLKPGVSDYQYSLGPVRNNLSSSWDYGPPALSARHNLGVTSWLTAGYRMEATHDLISGGPEVTFGLTSGLIDLALAASEKAGRGGAAVSFLYQYTTTRLSFSTQTQWMSPSYSTLGLPPTANRPTVQINSMFGYDFNSIWPGAQLPAISLQHLFSRYRNERPMESTLHQLLLSLSKNLGERTIVSASIGHALPGNRMEANQAFISIQYRFGTDTFATASYQHQNVGDTAVGSIEKLPPVGPGFGYMLQTQGGSDGQVQQAAQLQYQNDYGYYRGNYYHIGDQHSGSVTVAGGLVGIGGRVFPTRPVEDGFALLEVPGMSGVRCEWNNQEIGTTDRAGNCLYPELAPYVANSIGIRDEDVPLEYGVDVTHKTVSVPYRGGAIIRLPVHKLHQVTGTLAVLEDGKRLVPASGRLVIYAKNNQVSPIGGNGEFYFEDIPIGTFKAAIEYESGQCSFRFVVPEFDKPLLKMGELTCEKRLTVSP
jgi:outer membrane usher protein